MGQVQDRCLFCGRAADSCLVVRCQVICADCEQLIVASEASDPAYLGIVWKLRRLWQEG